MDRLLWLQIAQLAQAVARCAEARTFGPFRCGDGLAPSDPHPRHAPAGGLVPSRKAEAVERTGRLATAVTSRAIAELLVASPDIVGAQLVRHVQGLIPRRVRSEEL